MITKKVIDTLYKKYRSRPDSPDDLNIALLFDPAIDEHAVMFDGDYLIIGSIAPHSPFHKIALDRIHEIVAFENNVAIVLHSSIIFLDKDSNKVHVHVKIEKPSLWDKIRYRFADSD